MPLWYYVIILPEEEDYSLCFMLNLIIGELKQILELCGLITIKHNNMKFVINASGHGGNYSWPMFRLENLLFGNYFTKMSVARFNKYQRNIYIIGLSYDRDTRINLSSQFQFKKTHKYGERKILLIEKVYKMKCILQINTILMNSNIETK